MERRRGRARALGPELVLALVVTAASILAGLPGASAGFLPFSGCLPFQEKDAYGKCGCRRAVFDANGSVFHQGFFALDQGRPLRGGRTDCHPCPEGATCLGGSKKPVPEPGYWTNPRCPIGFSACEANLELGHSYTCLAPNHTRSGAKEFGECREGHEGVLCHKCSDGFGRDVPSSPFCSRCRGFDEEGGKRRTRWWHLLFLAAGVVFESGMSLSLIFTGLEADKRAKPEMSQLLKVLVSYLGIVKLLLSGNTFGWPRALQLFISSHKPPDESSPTAVTSFDCWFSNSSEYKTIYTYTLQIAPKFCSVLACTLYMYAHSYRLTKKYVQAKKTQRFMQSTDPFTNVWMTPEEENVAFPKLLLLIGDEDGRSDSAKALDSLSPTRSAINFTRNLLPRVAIVCSTSMWPDLLAWSLGFLACGFYPKSFVTDCDESSYDQVVGEKVLLWEYDKEMTCFSGLHSRMLEYVAVPILAVVLFPIFILRFLKKNTRKLYVDNKFDYTYGFLYRDYERAYFYWEFVIQVRTFAMTALIVYFSTISRSDQDLQGLLLLVVIFASSVVHTHCMPYVSDMVDRAEQVVLVDAAVIIISSMFFKLDMHDTHYWDHFREFLGLGIALLHVGTLLLMVYLMAKAFLKTYAIHADSDGDNIVSVEEAEAYFGTSKQSKAFIAVLKVFRLVEEVTAATEGHKKED
ncbi:hypothetical protein HOP50_02g10520 [Chloropicon primus]|uniref:EF-hand domain-containing protein n=2 Tax=Chloropicon primus TaxID=1764295 RepID=A0A5B8MD90_9CHLO|nr:hypothetical protein A3770_02p10660 [Chloropicon primus]UPQ97757.1 hypothetical protein HOP50_02g10520 [Chloropicon primus]|eukprot:QDZ18548.1 hypothetical protein A3770_02p10660 [Chloropicon primus]